jgi:hypothetical protein
MGCGVTSSRALKGADSERGGQGMDPAPALLGDRPEAAGGRAQPIGGSAGL